MLLYCFDRSNIISEMKTVIVLLFTVLASPAVNQYLTGKIQEKHLLEQRQLLMKDVFACNEQPKVSLIENLKLLYHCLRRRILHCDSRHRESMQAAQLAQDKNHTYCTNIIHKGVYTNHQQKTIIIQTLRNFIVDIDFFLFDFEWYSLVYHGLSVSEFSKDGGRTITYYTGRRLPWTMLTTSNTAVMNISTFAHLKFRLHLFYSISKWTWYSNIKAAYAGMLSDVVYPLDLVMSFQMRNRVFKALSYHFIQADFNRINISLELFVASEARVVIYDGPGSRSPRLLTTNKTTIITTTFHAYIEVYSLLLTSTDKSYLLFSQVDQFLYYVYPRCEFRGDMYGARSEYGRNTICLILWPTIGDRYYTLKMIKYIHEGTASTMTGYVTPKCQNGGLYHIPNQNKALCKSSGKMWLSNDGSVDFILIVWFAGYSRGFIYIEKRNSNCWTRHLDNEFVKHNHTVLINRVRRCQKIFCPQPTSPQSQMSNFELKIPSRPVGSSRIYIHTTQTFDDCVPGFGIDEDIAVYNVSTIYYDHSRLGYNKENSVSNKITRRFNEYFQYLVSGRVSIPRVCLRGQQYFRPYLVLEIASCHFIHFASETMCSSLRNYYAMHDYFNSTTTLKPGSIFIKHENYSHNYSRHHIITTYQGDCPRNCSNLSFDLKVYHKFNDSVAVYEAKIGETIPTGFNYQSFWMRINESPTQCPTEKCSAAVSVFDNDYLRQTDLNQASVKQNWFHNKR